MKPNPQPKAKKTKQVKPRAKKPEPKGKKKRRKTPIPSCKSSRLKLGNSANERSERKPELLEAETKLAETQAALEKASPITVQPTWADPLAHVTDQESLNREIAQFRALRDLARSKPQGWVKDEGTDNEVVITSEQAAQSLSWAEDVLTDLVPLKQKEIAEVRPASVAAAQSIMPTMFKTGEVDHQAAQMVWKEYPAIATNPQRDFLTAVMLLGFKTIAAGQQAAAEKNGKLKVPAAILKAHSDKGKVPLQKQKPPGRSSIAPVSTESDVTSALGQMAKTGGSRQSLVEGLKALNRSGRPGGKDLAQV